MLRGWLLVAIGATRWGEGCHFWISHVESSLISFDFRRLTKSLGRTVHPFSIISSAPGVAKEAGGNSGSAGSGSREEAICCLKDDANRFYIL